MQPCKTAAQAVTYSTRCASQGRCTAPLEEGASGSGCLAGVNCRLQMTQMALPGPCPSGYAPTPAPVPVPTTRNAVGVCVDNLHETLGPFRRACIFCSSCTLPTAACTTTATSHTHSTSFLFALHLLSTLEAPPVLHSLMAWVA